MASDQPDGNPPTTPVILKYPELADEHLREIGRIATAGAWPDMMVEHAIQQLGGIDRDIAKCVITHVTTHVRLDILQAIGRARLGDEAQIQRLIVLANRIGKTLGERNVVIHTVWASSFDSEDATEAKGKILQFSPMGIFTKARGEVVVNLKTPEEYKFEEVYDRLVTAADELHQFLSDLFDSGYFSS